MALLLRFANCPPFSEAQQHRLAGKCRTCGWCNFRHHQLIIAWQIKDSIRSSPGNNHAQFSLLSTWRCCSFYNWYTCFTFTGWRDCLNYSKKSKSLLFRYQDQEYYLLELSNQILPSCLYWIQLRSTDCSTTAWGWFQRYRCFSLYFGDPVRLSLPNCLLTT